MRENNVTAADLIYPVFVLEGQNLVQDVASMPGVQRRSLDQLLPVRRKRLALSLCACSPISESRSLLPARSARSVE